MAKKRHRKQNEYHVVVLQKTLSEGVFRKVQTSFVIEAYY